MDAEKKALLKQLALLGDVILINNKNRIDLNDNAEIDLKTQADAIIYFLQRLDITMIKNILDDNRNYQDFEKPLFIKKLDVALDEFIQVGDTYLNKYSGFCNAKN